MKIRALMLTLLIASTLCMATNIAPVLTTEMTQDPTLIGPSHPVDAVGTYFEITDSTYLNITLTSTETIHAILESVPKMISVVIESVNTATSTTLTFTGLEPNALYYRYQDGYFVESLTAAENGGFTYSQDISQRHHVMIKENQSTLYIDSDYTFTSNIYEPIVITADDIVIDGNGYILQGPGYDDGFYLYGRNNVTIKNAIIKDFTRGIHTINPSGNKITGNTITGCGWYGIHVYEGSGNEISSNILTNSWLGIFLDDSENNTVRNNYAANNTRWGILISYSPSNWISDNTLINNGRGIALMFGGNNTLRRNNMTGNTWNFGAGSLSWSPSGVGALVLSDFIQDIDTSNTVDGKPIYYLINQNNLVINDSTFPNIGYLALVNSTKITVKDLILTKNYHGILLAYTTDTTITNNNFSNNAYGIYQIYSSSNIVSSNTVSSNSMNIYQWSSNDNTFNDNAISNSIMSEGFSIWNCSGNLVYHNNIIDNAVQAYDTNPADNNWHHPDLLEGNYWSDYPGADDGSGAGKHAISGDGIGDTDIPWPGPDYDYYPLMSPWAVVATINISPERLNLKSNGEWITASITFPEGYLVEEIDVATVKLTYIDFVSSAEWVNTEGGVLMVKFDRIALRNYLGEIDLYDGERFYDITLTVSGAFSDGTLFEGSDTITVIKR